MVYSGDKRFKRVLDGLEQEGAPREEAEVLLSVALNFVRDVMQKQGKDGPVPQPSSAWFDYEY